MKKLKSTARKVGIALVGFPVLIIGIILIPLPGPGLLVMALGLLILAVEFEWARRHHMRIRKMITDLAENVRSRRNKNSDKSTN